MSLKEKIKHSDAGAYGDFPQLMKSSGFAPLMAGETKKVIFTGSVSMAVMSSGLFSQSPLPQHGLAKLAIRKELTQLKVLGPPASSTGWKHILSQTK